MTTLIDPIIEDVARIADDELLHYVRFLNAWQHLPGDRSQADRERVAAGLRELSELLHVSLRPNGRIEPYPHADLDGPCTGPCCEDYSEGPNMPYLWHCEGLYRGREFVRCNVRLISPGQCLECAS